MKPLSRGIWRSLAFATLLGLISLSPATAPKGAAQKISPPAHISHPVLAFYYTWYNRSTWCYCRMSDLPTTLYESSSVATIDRQITEAAQAGITGLILSWWGPGDPTDKNLITVLDRITHLQSHGLQMSVSVYLESDAPRLGSPAAIAAAIRYLREHYAQNPNFFHWDGKPTIFVWDPLGGGRSLAAWARVRQQADPSNRMLWSTDGTDMSLLSVFDGLHLFSGGYWGLQSGSMSAVDQGFRRRIDAYNTAHHSKKIWAAGVLPGYDDTRVPGRQGAYSIARRSGATYRTSWSAAISSHPEWITITTYNEWFEGSMIEPGKTYGSLYLKLTRELSSHWR